MQSKLWKGICMEDVRNSKETPCTENLMILRNFQYWHKFFIWFLLLLLKDVFEGFGHRPLNFSHLNLGLFEPIFIQILVETLSKSYSDIHDKQARDDSTIVPLGQGN